MPEVVLRDLRVETVNVGGDISIDRMIELIERWLVPVPLVIALTEIRLVSRSSLWQYQGEVWKRSRGEWWFCLSSVTSLRNWGLELLILSRVAMETKPPEVVE